MKRKSTPFNISHSAFDIPHSKDIIDNFENNIFSVLKTYPRETCFLAAVSGGADSMAMLAALYSAESALFENSNFNFKFSAVHVEHGIRPAEESRGDADFVRDFCREKKIECIVKHIPPGRVAALSQRKGCGVEAAARFFRHKILCKTAAALGENTVILLAHTKDDLLETALMRALRGAGPSGLAGMRITNEECKANGKRGICILRPLITMSRFDVIDYLMAKGVAWREDSTNKSDVFLRNKIRHKLVPLLNEYFPAWKKGVSSMAETQSLAADFLVSEADLRVQWKKEDQPDVNYFSLSINEKIFFNQPQIIREEAVFAGINKLSSSQNKIPKKSIKRSVVRQFCAGDINSANLGVVRLERKNEKIFIVKNRVEYFEKGISKLIQNID